jgi:hypothetical protein
MRRLATNRCRLCGVGLYGLDTMWGDFEKSMGCTMASADPRICYACALGLWRRTDRYACHLTGGDQRQQECECGLPFLRFDFRARPRRWEDDLFFPRRSHQCDSGSFGSYCNIFPDVRTRVTNLVALKMFVGEVRKRAEAVTNRPRP